MAVDGVKLGQLSAGFNSAGSQGVIDKLGEACGNIWDGAKESLSSLGIFDGTRTTFAGKQTSTGWIKDAGDLTF